MAHLTALYFSYNAIAKTLLLLTYGTYDTFDTFLSMKLSERYINIIEE